MATARIYVGNLQPGMQERELEDEFARFGRVRSTWVARKPPGFAFLEMEDERDANDAVRKLDGYRGWKVEFSRRGQSGPNPRVERYGGGGRDDRGRSPPRRRSLSPPRRRRSPSYDRRRSPSNDRDRRRVSPSPRRDRSRDRSPVRKDSRSPVRRDSPPRRDSRSPPRRLESRSPVRDASRSRSPRRD